MADPTIFALLLASPLVTAPIDLLRSMLGNLGGILVLVREFRSRPVSPAAAERFETRMDELLRELGRQIVQWTYNHLEPPLQEMPPGIEFESESYRRRTPRRRRGMIWTLFGPIQLTRVLYQAWCPGVPAIFPLEINLGIVAGGATPALALRAAWLIADASQRQTLDILQRDHGVTWSIATLRKVTASISGCLAEQRHEVQVARVLELLRRASGSKGSFPIVLAVGRDGVFVPIRKCRQYQEAAAATVTIYDRARRRLGTVYLGHMPQPGQATLSTQLTLLIRDVLVQWDGPLPRLCYVTDAGHHPTEFFHETLCGMEHPRTGQVLQWQWVLDYFHAAGYLGKLAGALFGEGPECLAWTRKMRRWLKKKPNGAYRILHSAAALKTRRGLVGSEKDFGDAYRYLAERLEHLRYLDYRRRGLPIGSGVTEAACKIIFTQRFKQSGMAWSHAGGQIVLEARLLRLSGVWDAARQATLSTRPIISLHPPSDCRNSAPRLKKAA